MKKKTRRFVIVEYDGARLSPSVALAKYGLLLSSRCVVAVIVMLA